MAVCWHTAKVALAAACNNNTDASWSGSAATSRRPQASDYAAGARLAFWTSSQRWHPTHGTAVWLCTGLQCARAVKGTAALARSA